jgi:hypothetical membrane protein
MTTSSPQAICVLATPRRVGRLGLVSVGIILLSMVLTAIAYRGEAGESYSPLNHFISELGEISTSQLAWLFNLGILVGGAGLGTFLMLLSRGLAGRWRAALVTVGAIAGVSGSMVGVFPMDYHALHRIVAGVFFLTGWLVAVVTGAWLLAARRPGFLRLLLLPAAVTTAISLAFIAVYAGYHPDNPNGPILNRAEGIWAVPFLEWASLLSLLAWFVCVSFTLIRRPARG